MLRPTKSAGPRLLPGRSMTRMVSRKADLESGAPGGEREQVVQIRHKDSTVPMDTIHRKKHNFLNFMRHIKDDDESDADSASGREEAEAAAATNGGRRHPHVDTGSNEAPPVHPHAMTTTSQMGLAPHSPGGGGSFRAGEEQYKLMGRRKTRGGVSGYARAVAFDQSTFGEDQAGFVQPCLCFDPNRLVNKFLHWTFRTSFLMLFLAFIVMFFVATCVFAGFILWSAHYHPQCIASSAFQDLGNHTYSQRAADAYALSWTTFSTVGYGLIYPQVSTEHADQNSCGGLKFLCSVEAFLGVLFAGFCGAVLFAKVSRLQAHAQILFSDPIVIRYGSGVMPDNHDTSTAGGESLDSKGGSGEGLFRRIPCPVLEFKIVNKLHSTMGGEIMDATLNVCASIDAEQVCPSIRRTLAKNKRRMKRKGHRRGRSSQIDFKTNNPAAMASAVTGSIVSDGSDVSADESESLANPTLIEAMTTHQEVVEDQSNLIARRIFSKLELETGDHPFFKRVWLARHVLDERSPLLTKEARKLVQKNDGFWPEELNNHSAVRNSVVFDNLLVSLSGTCNVNVATVFAHKTYDFVDVNVGYEFANVLYNDERTGALMVDLQMLNDVREQDGGGGEPFGFLGDDANDTDANDTANEKV